MKELPIKIVALPGVPKDQLLMISGVQYYIEQDILVIPKNNVAMIKILELLKRKKHDND